MGKRKVTVKESVAESIAAVAWYIESKGMVATAEKFSDEVYDYFDKLSDDRKSYKLCRDPSRASFGYKCVQFKKKYTIVFLEAESEILICEFISSKLIYW
ncbi:MAG: hypothetical protein ACTHJ5_15715 [Ilyomonas sp.]